MEQVTME